MVGAEALTTQAGLDLQALCSAYNMTARLDRASTQVVPITWSAVDETTGGFIWEASTNLRQVIVLPIWTHFGAEEMYDPFGFNDCQVGVSAEAPFGAGVGVAFAWKLDAYNPNNPSGGFFIEQFEAGVRGTVVECDITLDPAAFEGALVAVKDEDECLIADRAFRDATGF